MTRALIGKWGNAAAVRIPAPFCSQMGVSAGDAVELSMDGRRLVIERADDRHTLQARMRAWDGDRFDTHEYDWGGAEGEEVW